MITIKKTDIKYLMPRKHQHRHTGFELFSRIGYSLLFEVCD